MLYIYIFSDENKVCQEGLCKKQNFRDKFVSYYKRYNKLENYLYIFWGGSYNWNQ